METLMPHTGENLKDLYDVRFSSQERVMKDRIWKILCNRFFQKYVPRDARVLDVASGFGEFINHIDAKDKTALDLNPDTSRFLNKGIEFVKSSATQMDAIPSNSKDVVFVANFFEHMPTKAAMDDVLKEIHRILAPGGSFLILQPNIKYVKEAYWDFYDHHIALSHLSLEEGLQMHGFTISKMIPRFLPYTVKSKIPKSSWLVALYLRLPFFWPIMGKLMFVVAKKPQSN